MFAELTSLGSVRNVVLATTMWDRVGPTPDDGNKREKKLKKCWKGMIHRDADIERFLNSSGSAWSIVDNVAEKSDQKEALSGKTKDVFTGRSLMIWILRGFLPKSCT